VQGAWGGYSARWRSRWVGSLALAVGRLAGARGGNGRWRGLWERSLRSLWI